jgi:hypothetical protein
MLSTHVEIMESLGRLGGEGDPTRVAAQVVTGIGFLCAGTISREGINVGDLHSQLRELVDIKATRIRPPHPAWTGVGVTQLGVPGALLEISAVAVDRDY